MTNKLAHLTLAELEVQLRRKNEQYETALQEGKSRDTLLEIYKELKEVQFEITNKRNAIVQMA